MARPGDLQREGEDWFLRLPPAEQARLRASWSGEVERSDAWRRRQHRRQVRAAVESGLLLVMVLLALRIFCFAEIASAMLLGGPVTGVLLHWLHPERAGCALLGMLGLALTLFAAGTLRTSYVDVLTFAVAACVFTGYGLRREYRALDGTA
jgi:hypothetical protein